MLNSLQACRAVVAILIVIAHANFGIFGLPKYFGYQPFGPFFNFMVAGVDFFFVLSGFLILYAHTQDIGKPRELGGYFWKRYSRVFLFYWCVIAVVIPVYFIVPQFGDGYHRSWDTLLASIFLLPHPEQHYIIGVGWTLPFEMLFYALFGLLVINKRLGIAVFVLWTLGIFARGWFDSFPLSFVFNPLHLRIIAGMVVCVIFMNYRIPAPRHVAFGGIALFLTVGMIEVYHGLTGWGYIAGYTLSSSMIIGGFAESDRRGLTQPPKFLVDLGNATFSIYLVHFTVLSAIAKLGKVLQLDQQVPLLVLFVVYVTLAVGIGYLCSRWIEMPLFHWSKQFFRKAPPPPPVAIAEPVVEQDVRKAA